MARPFAPPPLELSLIPLQLTGHGLGFHYLAAELVSPWRSSWILSRVGLLIKRLTQHLQIKHAPLHSPSAQAFTFQCHAQPCLAPAKLGPRSQQLTIPTLPVSTALVPITSHCSQGHPMVFSISLLLGLVNRAGMGC